MANKERTDRLGLAKIATRQHGVISIRQLERLGFGRSTVTDELASGRLHRLHRGVYAVGHKRLTWHGYCLAAVLANSPAAVASHFSAGWLWGLLRNRPSAAFHITAGTRRHRKEDFAVHYGRLGRDEMGLVEGIPVTSLARTQLDLAARRSRGQVEASLKRSEENGQLDLRALEAVLDRCGNHPGRSTLKAALDIYEPDPTVTRSSLERRFRDLAKRAGLPPPAMNFVVAGYELDAYWAEERFVVELDLFETHGSRAAFEEDRLRQEELKLIGVEMIRVTGPRLKREPEVVIERVRTLLEGRRRPAG